MTQRNVSLVIPVYNEEESLPELYDWIDRVLRSSKLDGEIIFIRLKSVGLYFTKIQKIHNLKSRPHYQTHHVLLLENDDIEEGPDGPSVIVHNISSRLLYLLAIDFLIICVRSARGPSPSAS